MILSFESTDCVWFTGALGTFSVQGKILLLTYRSMIMYEENELMRLFSRADGDSERAEGL